MCELAAMVKDAVLVSESGVSNDNDIKILNESHVDALLIGTALMEADDPKALALRWKEMG